MDYDRKSYSAAIPVPTETITQDEFAQMLIDKQERYLQSLADYLERLMFGGKKERRRYILKERLRPKRNPVRNKMRPR